MGLGNTGLETRKARKSIEKKEEMRGAKQERKAGKRRKPVLPRGEGAMS